MPEHRENRLPEIEFKLWMTFWLSLPLLIPAIAAFLMLGLKINLGIVGGFLLVSVMLGGIPYSVFFVLMSVLLCLKKANSIHLLSYFAPLLFLPLLIAFLVLLGAKRYEIEDTIVYSLIYGYAYVFVYHLSTALFEKKPNLLKQ